ncbi:MAG TPA: ferredoxin [Acidimicrobiales bacterium]|nr:ferredoxin [Acidimicrobiales bacterium]
MTEPLTGTVLRIRIDTDICTGHGRCYMLAPDLFDTDDSGYGVVTKPDVPPELLDQAESARQNCPERAIFIDEVAPS